jgi:L-threonylcarbamoyladenylate synthase
VTAAEVCEQIGDKIELVIDGGRCPSGVESTVLDVTEKVPRILRLGAIPKEEIEKVCATVDRLSREEV